MNPLDPAAIAQALGRPQREGRRYRATCPACQKHTFTIGLSDDGQTYLIKCWAGCPQQALVDRLRELQLWPAPPSRNGTARTPAPAPPAPNGHRPAPAGATIVDGARWWAEYTGVPWPEWERWGARAIPGGVAFCWPSLPGVEKCRLKDGPKGLWQGSPTPWLWPELPEHLPGEILLTEGESDCGTLRHAGLEAYACTKGAGGGLPAEVLSELRRRGCRTVTIAFDADAAGRQGAEALARAAAAAGLEVAIVSWGGLLRPELGEKDVRDLYRRLTDPEALRRALVAAARPWAPPVEGEGEDGPAIEAAIVASMAAAPAPHPWPVMAPEAFHGLAGQFVRAVAPHTEADPVALLLSFLAAASAALGPGPFVVADETVHRLRLWPVLVGETSKARKGSSWAPVRRLLEAADPAFAQQRIASGLSSGEGLIWAVRDPVTKWQREKDLHTGVSQMQEVVVDPGESDKRLLVLEEEFTSVLKVLSRDGNTLSAVLRQAWERGDLRSLTKNSPAKATGAHIVVVGHAVAEELSRYLHESEVAGGLANRFLFACVRRSQCLPRGGRLPEATIAELGERLRRVFMWARERGEGELELRWSDDAGRLWDAVYPDLSEGKPGLVGALIARMEAQALRLAALYAVLDCSDDIQPEHLAAALAVVDYCEASARFVFGDKLGDPVADGIVEALRRAGPDGLSRWDLSNLFGRHVASGRISHALAGLFRQGLARPERRETGGRPAEVWAWCGR
jgi:hypothetical protein